MRQALLVGSLLMVCGSVSDPAGAAMMDFEGLGIAEGTILTSIPAYPNVTFTNARMILPGNPAVAFHGNSSGSGVGGPDDANSGATIAFTSSSLGTTSIAFALPVGQLTVDLADVEPGTVLEVVVLRVYDAPIGGTLLYTTTVSGGDPGTGDGALKHVVLSGYTGDQTIQRLEIERTSGPDGTRPGFAIDNIAYVPSQPTATRRATWNRIKGLYR